MALRFSSSEAVICNGFDAGVMMAKMTIFLGGFLVLTLLIGVLATISPV